ncbi:MAG: S-layer homology domain-containing protein [Oscillospiraceae bacterium]|jgi:hypothetical protein|nr:S-layer homology domain-containing protein [Oscillospiraceae bacterium]
MKSKRILSALLAIALLVSLTIISRPGQKASAEVAGDVTAGSADGMNFVEIPAQGYTAKILLANDKLDSSQPVGEIISAGKAQGELSAAVVGTYFDAYTGTNETYGRLYQDGQMLNTKWYEANLVQFTDGTWRIVRVDYSAPSGKLHDLFPIDTIQMAVACGPHILENGINVVDTAYNDSFKNDSKMKGSAQRTVVGIKADGSLLLGEMNATFNQIAALLLARGCTDAIAMDGGASSYLWANGTTIQEAGRKLNNVIGFYYTGVPNLPESLKGFRDIPGNAWYVSDIAFAVENKLFSGLSATSFGPGMPMTRAMLVTVLNSYAGRPAPTLPNPFADVPNGVWYTNPVRWAYENNIVTGTAVGQFSPDMNITREQLTLILYKYKGSPAVSGAALKFADAGSVSFWAEDAVKWCYENGIVSGKSGNIFDPQGNATRAEVAAMLHRFVLLP